MSLNGCELEHRCVSQADQLANQPQVMAERASQTKQTAKLSKQAKPVSQPASRGAINEGHQSCMSEARPLHSPTYPIAHQDISQDARNTGHHSAHCERRREGRSRLLCLLLYSSLTSWLKFLHPTAASVNEPPLFMHSPR